MKLGKHGKFLHDFVFAYIHDEISRWDFDLEYSGYIIAHFPGFEDETPRLAAKFARTVDRIYSTCTWMTDDEFAAAICDAMDEFLGISKMPDFY